MKQDIANALGTDYCMFYHPGLPKEKFIPIQTAQTCSNTVNYLMGKHGKNFLSWDSAHHDILGQLMRANWIYNRLITEPIRKPILVHRENDAFVVDCGDTRLMAVLACPDLSTLSALITVRASQNNQYHDWVPIKNNFDLIEILNFDPDNTNILFNLAEPDKDWCMSWFEIGDPSTQHHLHDDYTRVRLMQGWINTQPDDFKFTPDWITVPIDWASYQTSLQNL